MQIYFLVNGVKFDPKPPYKGARANRALEWLTYPEYRDGICASLLGLALDSLPVVDFLDEIGIDQRGYIEKGLAVEKTETQN